MYLNIVQYCLQTKPLEYIKMNKSLCPVIESAFEVLGKKWNGLIISLLLNGVMKFSEIKHAIPELSPKILTERLRELEKNGILIRSVFADTPVRIEYSLTQKGEELQGIINQLHSWASKWGNIEH
jgi:DNA-binding HxlR family transcriptional regulator